MLDYSVDVSRVVYDRNFMFIKRKISWIKFLARTFEQYIQILVGFSSDAIWCAYFLYLLVGHTQPNSCCSRTPDAVVPIAFNFAIFQFCFDLFVWVLIKEFFETRYFFGSYLFFRSGLV